MGSARKIASPIGHGGRPVTDPLQAQAQRRRAAKRQVERPAEELHEERPKLPQLVSQGGRSQAPRPRPPSADDWIRSAARDHDFGRLKHWAVP
jgi:hypothetical protein